MAEMKLIREGPDDLLIVHANGDGTGAVEHFRRVDAFKLSKEALSAFAAIPQAESPEFEKQAK